MHLQDRDPVSGGGFADIFQASFRDQPVALKRLRSFTDRPVSKSEENVSSIYRMPGIVTRANEYQAFRREALVSWFLDHLNIQSFMGIDKTTFPALICIVTPWQQNGNVLVWLAHIDAMGLPIVVDESVCPRLLNTNFSLTV